MLFAFVTQFLLIVKNQDIKIGAAIYHGYFFDELVNFTKADDLVFKSALTRKQKHSVQIVARQSVWRKRYDMNNADFLRERLLLLLVNLEIHQSFPF